MSGSKVAFLRTALAFYTLVLAAGLVLVWPGAAQAGRVVERISVSSAGSQASGYSYSPSNTQFGRFVAFTSEAANLVAGDTNGYHDAFLRDRQAGTTIRVSVASDGTQGNGESGGAVCSSDNHYVVFGSTSTNLVAGDTNGRADIFIHDRYTGATGIVSLTAGGAQGNHDSGIGGMSVSADGRYVAFCSFASNLVTGDTNGQPDVFVRDLVANTTERVSVDNGGNQVDYGGAHPSISSDGRYVAFDSPSSGLWLGDTNGKWDVFVRDRVANTTTRVSISSTGVQGNDDSEEPSISGTGRYVAFESDASNLVGGDTNGCSDVFIHDRTTGVTERVSIANSGAQANSGSSGASVNDNGWYVAFASDATNLASGGDPGAPSDIFIRDRTTRTTSRVSVNGAGVASNNSCGSPSISGSGRFVAYQSYADNLVAGDTNNEGDVFCTSAIPTYNSLRGDHRYHTAHLISQAMFPQALPPGSAVVLAPGETYQEALCGAPLAAAWGGPVLLTYHDALDNGTKAELQRLAPDRVICIGMSATVRSQVQAALPGKTVTNISGSNVYQMSRYVANALATKVGGLSGATAIVTVGYNFPDAIGVGPLACHNKWPVLLTNNVSGAMHPDAAAVFGDWGITKCLKVGTYVSDPPGVTGIGNLSGVDRYETNRNVAVWAKTYGGLIYTRIGLATGDKFPDALASGPYLAKAKGILFLTPLNGPLPGLIATQISNNSGSVWHVGLIAMIEPVIGQVKALLP
ncbi:MAG: cell wall-binding repeat-containing protein [Thermoleophilia bacterium]|nr:cell wall-binding repeat-containing protein [Thermoleophilia bacterium]